VDDLRSGIGAGVWEIEPDFLRLCRGLPDLAPAPG
jgi:hypothetical protein